MTDHSDRKPKTALVLPFATSAKDRIKDFTKDMEMATILYLAESNREKGEGHILKKPDEKLVFIAEAYYPIWLVPYSEGTLLFDGLGVTSHTLPYDTMPDINVFRKDMQQNARTCESFSVMLSRNTNYFKNFSGKEEKTIEGLIATPDFTQDFSAYLSEAKQTQKPLTTKAILTPTIDEYEISDSIKELSHLRRKIRQDIRNLDTCITQLNTTTSKKARTIRKQTKKTLRKFSKLIDKVKPRVTRKKRQIQEKYNRKITRASQRFERQLRLLHESQAKLEKTRRHLKAQINRCEAKIKSCRRRKNRQNETQWTHKLKTIKKRLPALEKNIKNTVKKIQNFENAKKLKISQLRIDCDIRMEAATKILRQLEALREAEIKIKRQKITSLKETTSLIINQMNEMTKSKKVALNDFDKLSMPRRKRALALVYLPFYLARYETEAKKRYAVYPPSTVSDMGILTKMKGALGAARMKTFLQHRSKAMTEFLNQLVTLIEKDPMLEKEITEAGIEDSVLRTKKLRMGVKRGLKELENEKWISKNELQTFSKLLYIYA